MASNKKLTDLINYTTVLPYASELFGIYQPLLGWKSKRLTERFQKGFANDRRSLLNNLRMHFAAQVDVEYGKDCGVDIKMKPGMMASGKLKRFRSLLLKRISIELPPYEKYDTDIWPTI